MKQPASHFVTCCHLDIHYTAWGDPAKPAVVIWHGLTRTSRDFDELADALSSDYYVICPDTPGRGLSQWCQNPETEYVIPFYAKIAVELLDNLGIKQCQWVGTSMGGLIGMVVAMMPESAHRISRMVLNDVGPEIPDVAIERIKMYVSHQPELDTISELESFLRQVYLPFGKNSDTFWRRMAITSARRTDSGKITLHYDPQLALPFAHYNGETLWETWPTLSCKTLIIRGEHSDLLLPEHTERMLRENRQSSLVTLPGIGHAPTLVTPEQINIVQQFLMTT